MERIKLSSENTLIVRPLISDGISTMHLTWFPRTFISDTYVTQAHYSGVDM